MNKEFYIGYLKDMPPSFKKQVKIFVVGLFFLVPLIAVVLVLGQKGFSTGVYELGRLSRIQGIVFMEPVPSLKIVALPDSGSELISQTVVLMSFGKFGAEGDLEAIAEEVKTQTGKNLNEVVLTLEGTLDYRDGRTLFELTKKTQSLIEISEDLNGFSPSDLRIQVEEFGEVEITGEIVDSKCYFGTMKPGNGKPHRSCAIRCISGGIPPILMAKNEKGATAAYLLRGPKGEAINQDVLEYVADPVSLKGQLMRYDDWYVLRLDPQNGILRIE